MLFRCCSEEAPWEKERESTLVCSSWKEWLQNCLFWQQTWVIFLPAAVLRFVLSFQSPGMSLGYNFSIEAPSILEIPPLQCCSPSFLAALVLTHPLNLFLEQVYFMASLMFLPQLDRMDCRKIPYFFFVSKGNGCEAITRWPTCFFLANLALPCTPSFIKDTKSFGFLTLPSFYYLVIGFSGALAKSHWTIC